jgi:hypothetical protein
VRFSTGVRIKITAFGCVTSCSLIYIYEHFDGNCCLSFLGRDVCSAEETVSDMRTGG